ncbi:hypothetical protein O5O45_19460 [Hahella aquimaris]|uniref:hypothetical protein n=1 Tax=Hahella sp. HNIBRBA332 TaxID=3015983 RepID=UPI00273C3E97|nr:hypothetical protein [Hahella sp. HNIBRBA332]WLQ11909.1 hypothetical protein O5O45_19460 [Hahella sp. HNIBRBA332]
MNKIISNWREGCTPLSQAPGRKKLVVAFPSAVVVSFLYVIGVADSLAKMLAIILWAYALIGLIETLIGGRLVSLSAKWDIMAGWKKFIISVFTIVFALFCFISLIPIAAKLL